MPNTLSRLKVEGWQSHPSTEIVFSPYVTCITGDTDSGKTSLLRALKKIIRDDPSGVEFISTWTDTAVIEAEWSNGVIVRRIVVAKDSKGDRKLERHHYEVVTPDGHTEEYTGFGTTMPDAVKQAIGMPVLEVGKYEVDMNFSDQHNPYFLVNKADGQLRLKLLSQMCQAEALEDARTEIKTNERRLKSALKLHQQELKDSGEAIKVFSKFTLAKPLFASVKADLQELSAVLGIVKRAEQYLSYVDSISILAQTLDSTEALLNDVEQQHTEYRTSVTDNVFFTTKYNQYTEFCRLYDTIPDTHELSADIAAVIEFCVNMQVDVSHHNIYEKTYSQYQKIQQELISIPNIDSAILEVISNLNETLYESKNTYTVYTTTNSKHKQILENIDSINGLIIKQEQLAQDVIQQLQDVLKQLHTCPVCEKEISDSDIAVIVGRL